MEAACDNGFDCTNLIYLNFRYLKNIQLFIKLNDISQCALEKNIYTNELKLA
jgi:hypothetical protein